MGPPCEPAHLQIPDQQGNVSGSPGIYGVAVATPAQPHWATLDDLWRSAGPARTDGAGESQAPPGGVRDPGLGTTAPDGLVRPARRPGGASRRPPSRTAARHEAAGRQPAMEPRRRAWRAVREP